MVIMLAVVLILMKLRNKIIMMIRLCKVLHFSCSSYSLNFNIENIRNARKQDSFVAVSEGVCKEIYW